MKKSLSRIQTANVPTEQNVRDGRVFIAVMSCLVILTNKQIEQE